MGRKKKIHNLDGLSKRLIKKKTPKNFKNLKGVKNIIGKNAKYYNLIINEIRTLAEDYGFINVQIPTIEKYKFYEHTIGKYKKMIMDELYYVQSKDSEKLVLRPEARSGIAKNYVSLVNENEENKIYNKYYYWQGQVFRNEKIKNGYYNQINQCNFEIFDRDTLETEILLIFLTINLLKTLKIDAVVNINNIGCDECRREYISVLNKFYKERGRKSKLCSYCKKIITKNPLYLLRCQEEKCRKNIDEAPPIIDYLCEPCKKNFTKLLEYFDDLHIPYFLKTNLIKEADYYNHSVFEIVPKSKNTDNNSQKKDNVLSLASGGRYNGLTKDLCGDTIAGCGITLSIDRIINLVKKNSLEVPERFRGCVFLAHLGDAAKKKGILLFERLRKDGVLIKQIFSSFSLKYQLEEAQRLKVRFSLILGQKEAMDDTIILRDMESGIQEIIPFNKIEGEIKKRLKKIGEL